MLLECRAHALLFPLLYGPLKGEELALYYAMVYVDNVEFLRIWVRLPSNLGICMHDGLRNLDLSFLKIQHGSSACRTQQIEVPSQSPASRGKAVDWRRMKFR